MSKFAAATVCAWTLAALACNCPKTCCEHAPKPHQQEPAAANQTYSVDYHGLHVVDNPRLRDIMLKLRAMRFEEMAREIELTGQTRRDIRLVAEMAGSLAADAQVIPMIFKDHDMPEESHRVMNTLSMRLREQAYELKRAADHENPRLIKQRLDEMMDTCIQCHASFRAPALAGGDYPHGRSFE